MSWTEQPLISNRSGGLEVRGERGPFAEDVYASGLLPVWGLDAKTIDAARVSRVAFGDRFDVERRDRKWWVLDRDGQPLGALKWRPGDSGKPHAQTGVMIVYPTRGVLHVERAVLDSTRRVLDIAGTVHPAN